MRIFLCATKIAPHPGDLCAVGSERSFSVAVSEIEVVWAGPLASVRAEWRSFGRQRTDSCSSDYVPSPQIVGEAGQGESGGIAGEAEGGDPPEAIAAFQGAEQLLDCTAAQRQS